MQFLARTIVRLLGINRSEALIGKLIVDAAEKRLARKAPGDIHEVMHLQAALLIGDTNACRGFRPEEVGYDRLCTLKIVSVKEAIAELKGDQR